MLNNFLKRLKTQFKVYSVCVNYSFKKQLITNNLNIHVLKQSLKGDFPINNVKYYFKIKTSHFKNRINPQNVIKKCNKQ